LKNAGVPVEDLSQLQADIATLQNENGASRWAEKIALAGDFRYRYEYIDVEGRDSRERNRIRARLAAKTKLPANTEVGIGMATGGDDPVSTNQTLGGGGSTKELRLDKAYFKWQASDDLYLQAGKFSNPLYQPQKSQLLWDGDWRPEGFSVGWEKQHLFLTFLGNYLESDSGENNDQFVWGLQFGTTFSLGPASLTTALGYYDFPTAGSRPFFGDDDEPEFFGNSSLAGRYLYDYQMIELGADLSLDVVDMPLSLFGHFVQNQDPDEYDTGWQAGITLGKASGRGTWQLGYTYQDLEADAVLGLLSDSDFAGGGTDGKGHRLSGALGINKQWNVGFTWFVDNEAGEKNLADEGGAVSYDRVQIDTVFKY